MNVLGIETSCDETSVAVVRNGEDVLSNVVISSLKDHEKFGGVIPEIASRRQMEYITSVAETALEQANIKRDEIDQIAVTVKPGLIGSLLVGTSFARALSFSLDKPLIEVDHIQAHLYANFLRTPKNPDKKMPALPAVGLIVSGGHTTLYYVDHFSNFELLGQTLDDAAGEAFDKVGRVLGLPYPGGPVIDRMAAECEKTNLTFPQATLPGTLNFSFSGVKTAVLYYHQDNHHKNDYDLKEVAYAFQKSVVDILVQKSLDACRQKNVTTLLVGGGVAANSFLRKELLKMGQNNNIEIHFPEMSLCLDNAAMIAGLGYHQIKENV